jgi:ABC-type phosphate transport system substrate-binding protein
MSKALLVVLALAVASLQAQATAAEGPDDILVVVNRSVKVDSTTAAELRNVFLKKKTAWRTGESAVPIHAPAGSVLRKMFRQRLLAMSATEEREYWKNAKIKHALMEPVTFPDTLKAVFKLRGGVSYVFRADYKPGVAKIVLVLPAD